MRNLKPDEMMQQEEKNQMGISAGKVVNSNHIEFLLFLLKSNFF